MVIKRRFNSIPMPNLKTISQKTTKKHLFEVLPSEPRPLHNAGWALKGYTHYFANTRLTVDFDTVGFRNMVGECFDMLTAGKPVFKAYQCHITIATKLTIPPRTKDFYFSKYTPICPWQSTVILSYCQSYCHMFIQS